MFYLFNTVPPHQLLIYDSSGAQVKASVGPYQVGAQFRLTCEVRGGKPTPRLIWLANDKEIAATVSEEAANNIVVSKILVHQLRRDHLNTTYKCRASNTNLVSPMEKSVLLDIYCEYFFFSYVSLQSIIESFYIHSFPSFPTVFAFFFLSLPYIYKISRIIRLPLLFFLYEHVAARTHCYGVLSRLVGYMMICFFEGIFGI